MKKLFLSVIVAMLALTLIACGSSKSDKSKLTNKESADTQKVETQEIEESSNAEDDTQESISETSGEPEWKQFLKDYEAWINKYIEITEKYKNNPSDTTILTDYTEMLAELVQWQTKAEELQTELENASPSEVAEYSAELIRIAGRIAEIAD